MNEARADSNVRAEMIARAAAWIASADVKATAILGAAANTLVVAVTIVTALHAQLQGKRFFAVTFGLAVLGMVLAILLAFLALRPRLDRAAILKSGSKATPLPTSRLHFGDLAKLKYADFEQLLESSAAPSEPGIKEEAKRAEEDLTEQAFVLNRIAAAKMCWTTKAIYAILAAMVLVVIAAGEVVLITYTGK